ncbi:MAG: LytTR family transcriptional regulator [Oscillospiraceae bacterium]|nr:LytTR family transcriptional regulator [Oscillospiraceae bacterium]
MKISLNQAPCYAETEIIIHCPQVDEDILRLVATLRVYQKKLVGILDTDRHLLDAKDILYIDKTDKKTFLYAKNAVYESALQLYELEDALRELDFFRAGRSTIINFRRIESIRPELGGRLLVTMDNKEQVYVSRRYAKEMNEKLRELERSMVK